jgi:hypothetical protein
VYSHINLSNPCIPLVTINIAIPYREKYPILLDIGFFYLVISYHVLTLIHSGHLLFSQNPVIHLLFIRGS